MCKAGAYRHNTLKSDTLKNSAYSTSPRNENRGSVTDYFFIKCVIHGLVTGAYRPSPLHMDTDTDQTQTYRTYWEGETAEGGGMKKGCVETG